MWNTRLDLSQAGIKIVERNINNLKYADDTTLMVESEEELKSILMKVKEESEKTCLKLNIQKMKIMTSGPVNSWQIDGETMETVTDFMFWGSKITADGDCSHENQMLTPWKESYDEPRQHLKSGHHFANRSLYNQSYGFPSSHAQMWDLNCKGGAPKNWCFWIVVLEKTLESLLDCNEIKSVNPKWNQPWIFKLKLQYFGLLMEKAS